MDAIRIKGYRARGGGVVTVTRGERSRRYRVSALRLRRLDWLLIGWPGSGGSHLHGGFDCHLSTPNGYAEALRAARRYGGRKYRELFPISSPAALPLTAAGHCPDASLSASGLSCPVPADPKRPGDCPAQALAPGSFSSPHRPSPDGRVTPRRDGAGAF